MNEKTPKKQLKENNKKNVTNKKGNLQKPAKRKGNDLKNMGNKKQFNKNVKTNKPMRDNKPAKRNNNRPIPTKPVKIIPLGGLGEIGKNITLYEYDGDMFLVDCGMSFPDEEMPGIDIVIPDFSYVLENKDKIKGLVVTHGHEDHIGAIPYLLKNFNLPIFATRLTIGLIAEKLKESKLLGDAKLNTVNPGDKVTLGKFTIEFIHVNHSIPDAVAFAITSPAGTVIHTGDFKIDTTPIDDYVIDIGRFAEYGKRGVLALLADSTNVERPGYTASEKLVGGSFSGVAVAAAAVRRAADSRSTALTVRTPMSAGMRWMCGLGNLSIRKHLIKDGCYSLCAICGFIPAEKRRAADGGTPEAQYLVTKGRLVSVMTAEEFVPFIQIAFCGHIGGIFRLGSFELYST